MCIYLFLSTKSINFLSLPQVEWLNLEFSNNKKKKKKKKKLKLAIKTIELFKIDSIRNVASEQFTHTELKTETAGVMFSRLVLAK